MADTLIDAGPTVLTTSAATIVTPATLTVIRQIIVCNETGTTQTVTISKGVDGTGTRLWYQKPVYPGDPWEWSGGIVLPAGTVLQAKASANSALTLTVSGVAT